MINGTVLELAYDAKYLEWGSDEQIDAFNAFCDIAEKQGIDFDKVEMYRPTDDEMIQDILANLMGLRDDMFKDDRKPVSIFWSN